MPPAHGNKRKREAEDEDDEAVSQSSQPSNSGSTSPNTSAKNPRTIGPTLPPASLDERPPQPAESDTGSSNDEDEFGPSLPTKVSQKPEISTDAALMVSVVDPQATAPAKAQRDEWMIVPPSSNDWSSRMDPTKLKNRKFNSGKGSKGLTQTTGKESNTNWTETPDEKKARLQREMMGIKDISSTRENLKDDAKARENARKLHEYNVSVMPQASSLMQD